MNTLKVIRQKIGVTQAELAAALGVTQSQISKYERSDQDIPPAVARALIQYAQTKGKRFTFNDVYAK
jgi:putative transcriptional regulator